MHNKYTAYPLFLVSDLDELYRQYHFTDLNHETGITESAAAKNLFEEKVKLKTELLERAIIYILLPIPFIKNNTFVS